MLTCDSCGDETDIRHVDRSRKTGKERGSLCPKCFRLIGFAEDVAENLGVTIIEAIERIIAYKNGEKPFLISN